MSEEGLVQQASAVLCVVAKAPKPGQVKTRLAKAVGERYAAQLAAAFLRDTLDLVERCSATKAVVAWSGTLDLLPALPERIEVWPQGDGDLGARMERCLRRALEHGARALVVGTDSPGLPPEVLQEALDALEHFDAVIGPAEDGGFYLLGLRQCPVDLLADLPWSVASSRERTIARLKGQGWTVMEITPWYDVDRVEDLKRLKADLLGGVCRAPATLQAITEHDRVDHS